MGREPVDEANGHMSVERLLAESEIRQAIMRYCRGVDRLDEQLVRDCYHEGATDSHGNFHGTAEEFIEWAFALLRKYDVTMHFVGNLSVEFTEDPDVAMCETYAIAYHRREGGQAHHNLITACRYIDRFERRVARDSDERQWRIAERIVVTEWLRKDPPEGWMPISTEFLSGARSRSDTVYTMRRAASLAAD